MARQRVATGADWAFGEINYHELRKSGFTLAMRYIVPSIQGKMISHSEIVSAHAAGVDLGFIYETSGVTWTGGGQAGKNDGMAARLALMSIDAPPTVAAYFTIDAQGTWAELQVIRQYIAAAKWAVRPYRCGIYGQYTVIQMMYLSAPDIFRWQTPAWSGGNESPWSDMFQSGQTNFQGVQIDANAVYQGYVGQWYADFRKQPEPYDWRDMAPSVIRPLETVPLVVPAGTATKITLYSDSGMVGGEVQKVRVAVHSATQGYTQIETPDLTGNAPVQIIFTERDVDGISLSRTHGEGTGPIGFAVE